MGKYEEALERAKSFIERGGEYDRQVMESIFPELKESEDERVTRAINNMLPFIPDEAYANNGVTKEGVLNWLEKQKEQKPVEWSEEDDNALVLFHELISFGYTERFCDAQTAEDMRRWLNERLKSLRSQPHWKPSEEQMEALENVIKCELSVGLHTRANILQTLQNELKKL